MKFNFSWLLLFLALLIPIDLPAGGSLKKESSNLQIESSNLFFANDSCHLYSWPDLEGISLRRIPLGTPLRIVRAWDNPDGHKWLKVQVYSLAIFENNQLPIRGWIHI